jgi:serine/threonine-protein kinase
VKTSDASATDPAIVWASVEPLLHEALSRPPGEREHYLDAACTDPGLRQEVDALLEAHERSGILDALAADVMVPLFRSSVRPPSHNATTPLPVLERYRIIERMGGGGMALVYRARDERLDRDVALKFIAPHLSADEAAKKRFLVEARAAASLEHPNVCTVHEIGETPDGQL